MRWRDVTGVIADRGTRFVLQVPPGGVLVGLARSDLQSRGDSRSVIILSVVCAEVSARLIPVCRQRRPAGDNGRDPSAD